MKKLLLISFILLGLSSCQKDETVEPTPQPVVSVERPIRFLTTSTSFVVAGGNGGSYIQARQGDVVQVWCSQDAAPNGTITINVFEVGNYYLQCNMFPYGTIPFTVP